MNPTALPAGILGAAALFWGVQSDLFLWSIPTALALEAPRWISTRWAFGRKDFNRFSDLCAALFGVMAVFIYATRESPEAILTIFRFGPLTLLPLVLGQLYSERSRVDMSAFFLFLRRAAEREGIVLEVDLGFPFLASLLLGSASGNTRGTLFYIGCAFFVGVALWSVRPRRVKTVRWVGLWLATSILGAGVIWSIQMSRVYVYRKLLDAYISRIGPRVDPSVANTAIGRVGRLKQSDSIFLRVRPASKNGRVPDLLRDASYNSYLDRKWYAGRTQFKPVLGSEPVGTWNLAPAHTEETSIIVSKPMPKGNGLLSIPYGTRRIEQFPAEAVEVSGLGVLRARGGPGFAAYKVTFADDPVLGAPSERALVIPENEEGIRAVAKDWGLLGLPPKKIVEAMLNRFADGFHYSVYRKSDAGENPLVEFLTTRQRGHCEYFAAASVLLLRASGIPARYETGFAVRERDRYEEGFVVRGRHAHAWARAYVNGKWQVVDATPSNWWPVENERRSRLRPMMDMFEWLGYRWTAWRWRPTEESGAIAWWVWVLAAVAGFIVWRNFRDWRPETAIQAHEAVVETRRGLDSELFKLEAVCAERGKGRNAGESFRRWCERVAIDALSDQAGLWRRLGLLHERHRFDPKGIATTERVELSKGVATLMHENKQA